MEARLGLRHRKNGDRLHVFVAALGVRVKKAHGVQLVAEELRPDGLIGGGGEDVQNAAPEGKLAAALHHAAPAVARGGEPPEQLLHGVFLPHAQGKRRPQKHIPGHGSKTQGFPGDDLQFCPALGKII